MASREPVLILAFAGALGITLGVATLSVLWTLYPVPRGEGWVVVGVGIASLVVVGAVCTLLTRIGAPGVRDSFVMGYAVGLVAVATVMIANEIMPKLRRQVPSIARAGQTVPANAVIRGRPAQRRNLVVIFYC